jgi:cellulose synthase/poly-beta-1,6-N-acetylglucosamine synthase-like glycosyltransferase
MKKKDGSDEWVLKELEECFTEGTPCPPNLLHLFQAQTCDFGLDKDYLKLKRINFMFAIKHRNDGKINSHRWFFQGVCEYLNPELCLMLDIGTRPERDSIYKLYRYMKLKKNCGGCCGEIEVDFSKSKEMSLSSYLI